MATVLKGKLAAARVYDSAQPVKLRFELTNNSDENLYVLKWYTPLEGLNSDCLAVFRNEKSKVAYDGPMIKRGHPGPEDYVLIPAGGTVTADVDVGESYAVSIPGDYRVELNIQALEHVPVPAVAKKSAALALAKSTPKLETVTGGQTKFKVKRGALQIRTRGATARKEAKALAKSTGADASGGAVGTAADPLPPILLGGTAEQQASAKQGHIDGFTFASRPSRRWPMMPKTRNGSGPTPRLASKR